MKCLKVPKQMANDIRKVMMEKSLIDLDLKIKRDSEFVYLPLISRVDFEKLRKLNMCQFLDDLKFEAQKRGPRSFMDFLKDSIESEKIQDIKKSFDIIGDVVILEIPEELYIHKYIIGKAALDFTKRKSVFMKKSEIKGITRTRELEFLAGEDQSETVHIEYGSRIMLDVKKVYFSPRLATERERVAQQVKDGEIIVDMFAGVGPFVVDIARQREVHIYAVDINPYAFSYLKHNIALNHIENKVSPLFGDVREVLKNKQITADRVIMNLPGTAYQFLDLALELISPGGILHYYEFASDYETPINRIKSSAKNRKVKILNKRHVKSRSPGVWHVGIDVQIE
ncbi:class I SAM-dependent methyltransferase [Methanobacterium alcaliphilum]|uniref:class I SAM-dependent methyltransferase n=1 Tax=Methanobacterium alcaliphilum TaxID=392018 RepID=UPI00200AC56E|nr:class I SAM-dependent methyltransferase family protein [Methanobacterium alcaliphilum]MCK9151262.1 class I SAM-dependent methyltransferase family protein [Methanobacterium alcaliphilum]